MEKSYEEVYTELSFEIDEFVLAVKRITEVKVRVDLQ
jgi:hypothetical protein